MNNHLTQSMLPPFSLRGYWKKMLGFEDAVQRRDPPQLDLTHPTADDKRMAAAIALDNAVLKFIANCEIIAAQNLVAFLKETFAEHSGFANYPRIIEQKKLATSKDLQSVNTDACEKFLAAYEYCALAGDEVRTKAVMSLANTIFVKEFWDDVEEDYKEQHAVGVYT